MSNITLTIPLSRRVDGKYDLDTMLHSCRDSLVKAEAEKETEEATVREAVHACFDQFPGAAINMPGLISMATQRLNAQPANWKVLADRTASYIHDNAQGDVTDKATGTVQFPNSLFVIGKGKGGGVRRRSDIVAKPEADVSAPVTVEGDEPTVTE